MTQNYKCRTAVAFRHVPSYQNAHTHLGQQQKLGVRRQVSCKGILMPFPQIIPWATICLPTELSSLVSVSEQDSHHLLHWKCKISVNALLTDRITFVSCCSSSGSALKSAVLLRPVSAHLPPSFPVSIQRAH